MIEVYPNLYIGNQNDYETHVKYIPGWFIVHACKEPYHRQALGYRSRGAPKNHPEYFIAKRGNRLILNLVDVNDPSYISKEIIDAALNFINEALDNSHPVLVHCNQGMSRSAGIGLLYLAAFTNKYVEFSFQEAEMKFRSIYSPYNPAAGMRIFIQRNWEEYRGINLECGNE